VLAEKVEIVAEGGGGLGFEGIHGDDSGYRTACENGSFHKVFPWETMVQYPGPRMLQPASEDK
jgi:hypothetical protein